MPSAARRANLAPVRNLRAARLQVVPTVTAGVRMTGTIQFPLVGLVLSADYFPKAAAGDQVRVGVMGRLSL